MARKHQPEEIIGKLREAEIVLAQGGTVADASGNLIAIDSYDEYGIPGAYNLGRFQYTGQAWLPELGMYYYKARIYSPTLGGFLQADPIGYKDQINLYAYVGNDPINSVVSTGAFGLFGGCPAGSVCTSTNVAASNAAVGAGIPTIKAEREAVKAGNYDGYWASRAERGDPVGRLAHNFKWNGSAQGLAAISRSALLQAVMNNHITSTTFVSGVR